MKGGTRPHVGVMHNATDSVVTFALAHLLATYFTGIPKQAKEPIFFSALPLDI